MKCTNIVSLESFVTTTYPDVQVRQHTLEHKQFTFSCGLIMNIYTTGTVTFQGNSANSTTMIGIVNVINTINAVP